MSVTIDRRQFIKSTGVVLAGLWPAEPSEGNREVFPVSCNQYAWGTFYAREGRSWGTDLDASLKEFASVGFKAYEPSVNNVAEVETLLPLLRKHGLQMPSVYINSVLHDRGEAEKSIRAALEVAAALKPAQTRYLVTNPSPLKWGSDQLKDDAQLEEQARNLDLLGAELRKRGLTLAYHTHDVELKAAAREFHHMLQATSPENVSLCLDAHWVYRGAGNSQVALFDIVQRYGKRIAEIHLRQSRGGIWQETFGEGDIDYHRLAGMLKTLGKRPLLVLEQCLEKASPNTMSVTEAHRKDLAEVKRIFG